MLQARPELNGIKEYVPGKSIPEIQQKYGLSKVVKLASNENPLGPSPKAMEAFRTAASQLHLYPQGHAPELVQALASKLGVAPDCIIPGNGSDEILDLVGRAYLRPGDRVLGASSTFSVYESVTLAAGAQYVPVALKNWAYDLQALRFELDSRTRVVFICNPNNPTGTWLGQAELVSFLEKVPTEVLVVVDQAYCEFAHVPDYPDLVPVLGRFPNLLLTRTFSKLYGLAGLRVGYGIGAPELIRTLWKVKPPFNLNLPAQAAAVAALSDSEHVEKTLQVTAQGLAFLKESLEKEGYECLPTQANFLCIHVGPQALDLVSWLESQGLIVRGLRSFGMPEWIRVTAGLPSENELFLNLLAQWRAEHA